VFRWLPSLYPGFDGGRSLPKPTHFTLDPAYDLNISNAQAGGIGPSSRLLLVDARARASRGLLYLSVPDIPGKGMCWSGTPTISHTPLLRGSIPQ